MTKPHEPVPAAETAGKSFPPEVQAWLNMPFAVHLARWKREIAEGLRDCESVSDDKPAKASHPVAPSDPA
jgi:hypothetical protein